MAELSQNLIQKQERMTFDQLQQQFQTQLNRIVQKNLQLKKKSDSEPDHTFLKNFQSFQKQLFEEICQAQETIKFLMNKAKMVNQKKQGKKCDDDIKQQVEIFKTSVKKIMNKSFAEKHEILRRQSQAINPSSVYSDGMNEDGGNDNSSRQLQQQQYQEDQQQREWIKNEQELLEEQQKEFNNFEREIIQINQNFNRIGEMIVEQGHHINVIEETHFDTKQNVDASRREITKANEYQKSAKRKYIIFALIILIALAVTLAIVFTQS